MKKLVIVASLVGAVALGAFAKEKFFSQATAYYVDGTSTCVSATLSGTPIQALQTGDTQASIKKADGTSANLFINSNCTGAAEFNP